MTALGPPAAPYPVEVRRTPPAVVLAVATSTSSPGSAVSIAIAMGSLAGNVCFRASSSSSSIWLRDGVETRELVFECMPFAHSADDAAVAESARPEPADTGQPFCQTPARARSARHRMKLLDRRTRPDG
jgi:hypothetical protein